MATKRSRVVGMFQPTGRGKTLAMEGSVMTLGGITLFFAPNVLLAECQATRFAQDGFQVANLEDIKTNEEAKVLKNFIKNFELLRTDSKAEKKRKRESLQCQQLIVVCSPQSFADPDFKWYDYFEKLDRKRMLALVLIDECHLTPHHGNVFRQLQYKYFLEFLRKLSERKKRAHIIFASATVDKIGMEELEEMCHVKITDRCHATPHEMSCRDICFHMQCRATAFSTSAIKKKVEEALFGEDEVKIVISSNSKSRTDGLREHGRLAAIATDKKDTFVVSINGSSASIVKKTAISLFCGHIPDHELSANSRIMVLSANTGSEGYDNHEIRLVFHEGAPTSVAQLRQEAGRCRCVDEDKSYDYYIFTSLHDLLMVRNLCLNIKPDNWNQFTAQEKAILEAGGRRGLEYLYDSYRFIYSRECWHVRLENRYGCVTSDADKSTEPCDDKCPYCTGELNENTIEVDREALCEYLRKLFRETDQAQIPVKEVFLNALYDESICKKLYGVTQNQIRGKYKVESLVIKLIVFGILGVRDVRDKEKKLVPCVFLAHEEENDGRYALKNEERWRHFRLREPVQTQTQTE